MSIDLIKENGFTLKKKFKKEQNQIISGKNYENANYADDVELLA